MPPVWHYLVRDTPDASPVIVDIVAHSPGIAHSRCPISLVITLLYVVAVPAHHAPT